MPSAKEWQGCVDAVWFVRFYQQRLWLRWSESAGWVLGVRCQVWIRPVCVIIEGCIVRRCVVYEVISFFSTRVSTVRCRLLSPPPHAIVWLGTMTTTFSLLPSLYPADLSSCVTSSVWQNQIESHTHLCFVVHRSTKPAHFALWRSEKQDTKRNLLLCLSIPLVWWLVIDQFVFYCTEQEEILKDRFRCLYVRWI